MKDFFDELSRKIQRFMCGRYGFDELSKIMMIVSVVCCLLSIIIRQTVFLSLAIVLIVIIYLRFFSKNVYSRCNELNVYYDVKAKIRNRNNLRKMRWRDRKKFKYFRCNNCKTVLRVPRGKGKIEITCGKCKNKMIKKS